MEEKSSYEEIKDWSWEEVQPEFFDSRFMKEK